MGNNLEHDWETMTENQFEVPVDVTNLPTFLQFVNRNAVHQIKIVELRCKNVVYVVNLIASWKLCIERNIMDSKINGYNIGMASIVAKMVSYLYTL